MQRFFDHIFANYDSLLPKDSDEITKRLQIWLNNPKFGHKEGGNSQFFCEITIKASSPICIFILTSTKNSLKYKKKMNFLCQFVGFCSSTT